LKNDNPITKFDDDKLGRKKFACQFRSIIKNYNSKKCLSLGLMGPWGSGKTSLVNMIFEQNDENILSKRKFKVMRFNPWNFSKQQDLYFQFFDQLKDILISNEYDVGNRNKINDTVKEYWEKIMYNSTISLSLKGFVSYSKSLGDKPLEKTKHDLSRILRRINYKLIIIIDDIDRLTDDEIQQIFILVKALADFPNIIYILPFDKKVIVNSLDKLQGGYGNEFLDKIIQLQIDVPKISSHKVKNIFKDELYHVLESENRILDGERNIWLTLSFLTTVRDVNRYVNSLIFYLPLMENELNDFDFILLTGIQLFENEVYHEIADNKTFFTKSLMKKPDEKTLKKYKEIYSNILNKRMKISEEALSEVLNALFPQLVNLEMNWDLSNQRSEWNSNLRLCSSEIFDKYFEFTLGEFEMSNALFNSIIQSDDYGYIKAEVLKNDSNHKSEHFLEKLRDNARNINPNNIKLFFRLLYDVGDNLDVETGNILFSKNTLLLQNIGSLSRRLDDSQLFDAMDYAIKHAEDGLYLLVDDLSIHDKINQRYRFKNQKSTHQKRLSDSQLDELERHACIKIKKWAEDGKIFSVYRAIEVIYEWYYWDNEEYTKFINKTIDDDENLIKLLMLFIMNCDGENKKITHCEFDLDSMETICPINEIYGRVYTINQNFSRDCNEKILCESFISEFDGKYN